MASLPKLLELLPNIRNLLFFVIGGPKPHADGRMQRPGQPAELGQGRRRLPGRFGKPEVIPNRLIPSGQVFQRFQEVIQAQPDGEDTKSNGGPKAESIHHREWLMARLEMRVEDR